MVGGLPGKRVLVFGRWLLDLINVLTNLSLQFPSEVCLVKVRFT